MNKLIIELMKGLGSMVISVTMTINPPAAIAQDINLADGLGMAILQTALTSEVNGYVDQRIMSVTLTGYSSTHDQTDDTPFITASNKTVKDGIVAANFLPFGTKIQVPKLFGDKVFIVEDRMHARFSDRVDIWFSSREQATSFGKRTADIVILN